MDAYLVSMYLDYVEYDEDLYQELVRIDVDDLVELGRSLVPLERHE